mgnify:CR=1 FL=1
MDVQADRGKTGLKPVFANKRRESIEKMFISIAIVPLIALAVVNTSRAHGEETSSEIVSEDSKAPGEARSIMRYISGKLKAEIDASLKGEMSLEQRAHLEDCSHQIDEALNPRKG